MKKLFILSFIFLTQLFSYEYFQTFEKDIIISETKLFEDKKNLDITSIIQKYNSNEFTNLSGKSFAKGFSKNKFWLSFKLNTKSKKNLYLISNHLVIDHLKLYKIQNNLVISQKSKLGQENYIELGIHDNETLYVLEYQTDSPIFISFEIAKEKNLYKHQRQQHYITIFLTAVALALIISNLFLYISTLNRLYLYYSFMSLSFLIFNLFIRYGKVYIEPYIYDNYKFHIIGLLISFSILFLYLFSKLFLDLKNKYPKYNILLKRIVIIFISLIVFILILGIKKENIFAACLIIFSFITLIIALKIYFEKNNKIVKYYLIATGVQLAAYVFIPLLVTGKIEYNIFTFNILFFALIWDMLFLSFAIGFRIKELEENEILVKNALVQSRQATFGTMIDTISHQWKQPLNELGLQIMNLEKHLMFYNQVPKKEMLQDTINKSNTILEFMSSTIDTFRNFYKTSKKATKVNISETLENTILFLDSTFKTQNITIKKQIEPSLKITCLEEEFAHSILNILVNAKDEFQTRNIQKPVLTITMNKYEDSDIIIDIKDNAGGIKFMPISNIFLHNISSKKNGGIGLFISHKIITEKIKGSISVKNSQEGAHFTIILPLSD